MRASYAGDGPSSGGTSSKPRTLGLRPLLASLLFGTTSALVALAGCSDEPAPQPCTSIPAGGCPVAHGVGCADPACEAVYACRPGGVWERKATCAGYDAGAAPDASVDAGPRADASIDAPPGAFGGPGCVSLQVPDCALGVALACGEGCCGCEDLFVCEQGGWVLWGACADGGAEQGR